MLNRFVGVQVDKCEVAAMVAELSPEAKERVLRELRMRRGLSELIGRPYSRELYTLAERELEKEV